MVIREIVIPNLGRREDRRFAMLGHLMSPQIDASFSRIHFFKAHDGQNYDSTESVVKAAITDGFPEFEEQFSKHDFGKNRWATHWTYCSCLRKIAECPFPAMRSSAEYTELPYLFLVDDMRLKISFPHLEFVVDMAMQLPGPFYAMQLYSYRWPWDIEPMTLSIDGFLQEGFGGRGDYGIVLTPTGAKMLLEEHFKEPYDTLGTDFLKLSRLGTRRTGFYSCKKRLVDTSSWEFGNDRESDIK